MSAGTPPTSAEDILDVVVVGAGVYGICFAATYLSLHPSHSIRVLDADTSVGGVWSSTRHYPLFWAQTGSRVSGFPDLPFKPPVDAEEYYDLVPAKYLSDYLEEYVDSKVYAGRGLRERFEMGIWVKDVRKIGELWRVVGQRKSGEVVYWARKLVVATGLSSLPQMPDLPGKDAFKGPILHQKDVGRSKILTTSEDDIDSHESITIYGGSKSAADIAYAAAKDTSRHGQHRKVNWIVRSSGSGPLTFVHPKSPFGKYRNLTETGTTRAMACLSSANPYLPANSWREWFLYHNPIGDAFLNMVWSKGTKDCAAMANFAGREGALEGFGGLESTSIVRWRTGPVGILQRDDFWDVVARRVQVWRGDVKGVRDDCIVLEDGREVKTDVLLCCTGWREEMVFISSSEAARVGLPIAIDEEKLVAAEKDHWQSLDQQAEQKVLQRWPSLKHVPAVKKSPVTTTPYRLYRYTTPIRDHSIAFLGIALVVNSYHTALIQSLFAIACLDNTLPLPSVQAIEEDIAFTNAWCRTRYPVHGYKGNALDSEMLSFTDRLLEQLGLSSHRLPEEERMTWKGWWTDTVEPALASQYNGILEEYRSKYMGAAKD